jgi:hypothetical protein
MRVLTWNVWWRFGPWEERRKAILEVLRDLQPDVIGLQEVWARGGENLAEWLASSLGMHGTWAASRAPERWQRRIGDAAVDIGNAVLSRWPITEHARVELPAREDDDDGRLALYARIDAPAHQVPFFTAHLTSAIDASAVRCQQVKILAGFVARTAAEPPSRPLSRATSTRGRTLTKYGSSAAIRRHLPSLARSSMTRGNTQTRPSPQRPGTRPTRSSPPDPGPASASITSTSADQARTVLARSAPSAAPAMSP